MDPRPLTNTSTLEPSLQLFTNLSHLKRTTCDLCRERKVRCDRGKPQCSRCKRTGQKCAYPSASGEVTRINSELRSLQSRLRLAESKLHKQDMAFPVELVGPVLTSRSNNSPPQALPLTTETTLGDLVIPPDLESCAPRSISSGYGDSAPWPSEPPHMAQRTMQQNAHPDLRNEVGEISPATTEQLQMPLIDTTEFIHETAYATLHQHQALKYAVAMAGAGARNTTLHLEHQYYVAARSHLEMAETHMGNSSFLNLETAQTLILIARYEFTRADITRAIITMARLMQLIRLLELDIIDRRRTQDDLPQNLQKIQESRNTLWIAYAFHCHASTIFSRCEPIDIQTIHTALPCDWTEHDGDIPHIFLSEAATHPKNNKLSSLAIFVLAMRLAAFTEQHHRMTEANVSGRGAPDYNFCLAHERIENMIGMILSALSGCSLQTEPDKELRVLTLVVTFGARITLYKAAIVNVKKASFLGPVVGESEKTGVLAANAMCDVLLQADVLNPAHVPMYRAMSVIIMRPLALAAEFQLSVVRNSAQGNGMGMYYMNREIRHSMEVICGAMEAFQEGMCQYDAGIRECREYLDRTQFGNRFSTEFGNKRMSG
ncbi:Fungal transcriptional regulatory protein, N-terminal [Penicillium camemberti]|uniref:Fungal transcriptional regulatory protein, N-terminal n=1 Tax=Penicillium camemberti (strain FM 013) TaxID=1429867 RepID=A0A0G4NWJ6_PENC3|nr:Fungal transcriptional regulatory protein, N-terminal [Penicillium camemberti]